MNGDGAIHRGGPSDPVRRAGGGRRARRGGPGHARRPLCEFRPVAATVQGDDTVRYLCCGVCAAEWHLTRIHCAG